MPTNLIETKQLKAAHRKTIASWTQAACEASGKSKRTLAYMLGVPPGWLVSRSAVTAACVMPLAHIEALAKVTRHPVPDDVRMASTALVKLPKKPRRLIADGSSKVVFTGQTGEQEMLSLISLSQQLRFSEYSVRNVELLKMRFGIGGAAALTLEAVGAAMGLTRERVRQVEAGALGVLKELGAEISATTLNSIAKKARRQLGTHEVDVEAGLRPILGDVSLDQALRFHKTIWPLGSTANSASSRRKTTTT